MARVSGTAGADSGLVRVSVVEDQPQIREGLRFLIDSTPDHQCAGVFRSVEEALAGLGETDVVLMDIGLPGLSGIEGIWLLKERRPRLLVVALTVYDSGLPHHPQRPDRLRSRLEVRVAFNLALPQLYDFDDGLVVIPLTVRVWALCV